MMTGMETKTYNNNHTTKSAAAHDEGDDERRRIQRHTTRNAKKGPRDVVGKFFFFISFHCFVSNKIFRY